MKPVLFISDLHLSTARPAVTELLVRFLRGAEARGAQALYVLGDLFDYWIGDDDRADALSARVLDETAALSRSGTRVFFLPGNRDFLLGKAAAERGRISLIADPSVLDLFGARTVITHGDDLCIDDAQYQAYRRRIQAPLTKRALLALPLGIRRMVVRYARRKSEASKQSKPAAIMDVNTQAVLDRFRATGASTMIHGHTHRPDRHRHEVDGRRCERWVLADWHESGSYLRVSEHGIEPIRIE